jgi:hypothetical protein
MGRSRHPDKHIEKAIKQAEMLGWRVEMSNGHAWGKLYCPENSRDGCIIHVWSTPRVPENHARQIGRDIDLCTHSIAEQPATHSEEHQSEEEERETDGE